MLYSLLLLLLLGSTLVFYSLSPYYAALGLVLCSLFGCVLLSIVGLSFIALLLLIIYLGGMLVVFIYSRALSADRYPVIRKLGEVFLLFLVLSFWVYFIFKDFTDLGLALLSLQALTDLRSLSVLYVFGAVYFLVAGLALLIVLIVALTVSFGAAIKALRSL